MYVWVSWIIDRKDWSILQSVGDDSYVLRIQFFVFFFLNVFLKVIYSATFLKAKKWRLSHLELYV